MFLREVKLVNSFAGGKRVLEDKVKLHLFVFFSVRGADAIYADTRICNNSNDLSDEITI